MPLVFVAKKGGLATVQLNRPDKRNAMSFALLRELIVVADRLKRDKSIRAIILTGAGSSFSAGIDLSDLNSPKNAAFAAWELLKPGQSLFQKAFLVWQTMPVPVIAALHGHCLGAGMQLALAADIRISTPDCQLSIMESRWGLVPDMGITQTLRGLVPVDVAKELTLSGRIFSGTEAKTLGVVTHLSADPR
ncbi:MAG: crotonase/enoyl-CoA hydratase family protein, partial [Flavobacteriales bacterium]